MLRLLHRITQEVGTAADLNEALAVIVERVKEAIDVDVCSIYVVDNGRNGYLLMATNGLRAATGYIRFAITEGLVGLVGESGKLINLDNASDHPSYNRSLEIDGERFQAFLGAPIFHYQRVVGVLVAQQRQSRLFTEDEAALLFTVAAQLGGLISAGIRDDNISMIKESNKPANMVIQGVAGTSGFAVGTVLLPSPLANLESIPDRAVEDVAAEEAAFKAALAIVLQELRASSEQLSEVLSQDTHQIFDFYQLLLEDDALTVAVIEHIRTGNWAPAAVREAIMAQVRLFEQMEDSYLRARAEDIRGIGQRLLLHLQADDWQPQDYPTQCILVGEEVSVACMADVPLSQLAGIVCTRGSVLSHTAILARALDIPAVMGLGDLPFGSLEGCEMVVDGYKGQVIIEPLPAVKTQFQRLVTNAKRLTARLETLRLLPAKTTDDVRIPLYANIGLLSEITPALDNGAEGIGLCRTEFTFSLRESFPSEEEQYHLYRALLEAFAPRPVTLRALDIGGDKHLPYFAVQEASSFLGWRGIRILLDHPEIFLTQLRAMLRANATFNNLQILLPMITTYREVDETRTLLAHAYRTLREEGQPASLSPLGVMLEVPAALYQIKALASRVDYFSLGTNDLTQHLLAVERSNASVAKLYNSLHPAVIGALEAAVQQAHRYAKPISVCGEMASDPLAVILLLGMGIDSLSMPAPSIPRIKWVVRSLAQYDARQLLREVLDLEDERKIHKLLQQALEQAGLGTLVQSDESDSVRCAS